MRDMEPGDLVAGKEWTETTLQYHDASQRRVLCVDLEVPFPDGRLIVSRTDRHGRITHANASFVAMSGYSLEDLIGQPHALLRHPDMPAAAFEDLWQTVAAGQKWHGYVKNLRRDGAYYWVYATVIPNVRASEVIGYTSVRRKPARNQVQRCIELYAQMKAQEERNP